MSTGHWSTRADLLQDGVDVLYGAPMPQYLHNRHPYEPGDDEIFNYWWLAHVIDCRLDAYGRTHDERRLEQACLVHDNIIERNGGDVRNDYFDDMLWFALATLRLYEESRRQRYLDEVLGLWEFIIEYGWNDIIGPSLSWRIQQPGYKNAPANAPLAILGARLHMLIGDRKFLDYALQSFAWICENLVGADGFVADGMNRLGDGEMDSGWKFTYNQGTYIGAAVELSACSRHPERYMALAEHTVRASMNQLVLDEVFAVEGVRGDEGLFKGIFYRYAGLLLSRSTHGSPTIAALERFIVMSTERMWDHGSRAVGESLLFGDDWNSAPVGPQYLSTQLSAVMAAEQRVGVECRRSQAGV